MKPRLHVLVPLFRTITVFGIVTTGCTGSNQDTRSEEHTSELQSPCNLVCRLLLEKKNSRHRLHSRATSPRLLDHLISRPLASSRVLLLHTMSVLVSIGYDSHRRTHHIPLTLDVV